MQQPYLEVTFRHGRPIAAYYYLPRNAGQRAHGSRRIDGGLVIDLDEQGQPIGIEITAPTALTVEAFNAALADLGLDGVGESELAPLRAA